MDETLRYLTNAAPYLVPAFMFGLFVTIVGKYMIEQAVRREKDFDSYLEKRDRAFTEAMERMRNYMAERDERFERSLDKIETRTLAALERLSSAQDRTAQGLNENTRVLAQHASSAQLAISKILEAR